MRIRRSVIIPAIVALSAVLGSAAPAVFAQGATSSVASVPTTTWYHG
jgi:hypothetical protein